MASVKLGISHSAVDTFLTCPKLYYYKNVAGIHPVDQSVFTFGRVFHAFLEEYWDEEKPTSSRYDRALNALHTEARSESLSADDLVVAEVLAVAYSAMWGSSSNKGKAEKRQVVGVLTPDGTIDPELRLKAIFDLEMEGPRSLMEHKTTRTKNVEPGSPYWRKVRNSQQLDIYFVVGEDSGEPFKYIEWSVVKIPNEKRRKATPLDKQEFYKRNGKYGKKGDPKPGTFLETETLGEYRDRLIELIANDPERFFQSNKLYPNTRAIEKTRYDVWAAGRLMLEAFKLKAFPRNRQGCIQYGRLCAYHPICFENVDPERSELYTIKPRYSPLRVIPSGIDGGDGATK